MLSNQQIQSAEKQTGAWVAQLANDLQIYINKALAHSGWNCDDEKKTTCETTRVIIQQ